MIPALRRVGHEVVAVMSASASHGTAYARIHEVPWSTTNLDALLVRDDIDAVYVSSRNPLHRDQVVRASAAGKHVLCEKPLATSIIDARAMVEACAKASVVLAVNHHLPAAGTHRAIQELVARGAIGRPIAARVSHVGLLPQRLQGWRLDAGEGAGAVLDLSCHDSSALQAILRDRPVEVSAFTTVGGSWAVESEDTATASIRYASGVLVSQLDSYATPWSTPQIEIFGDEGVLKGEDIMSPDPRGDVSIQDESGRRWVEVPDRRHPYDVTVEAFASAVAGKGSPIVDGEEGTLALAVSLAILESARTGLHIAVS
jgi:1,5-anhydro-D-fructose reductase (1,5-anhydro-D-mannitol-forming)